MTKLFFIIEVCYKTSATSYQVEKIKASLLAINNLTLWFHSIDQYPYKICKLQRSKHLKKINKSTLHDYVINANSTVNKNKLKLFGVLHSVSMLPKFHTWQNWVLVRDRCKQLRKSEILWKIENI